MESIRPKHTGWDPQESLVLKAATETRKPTLPKNPQQPQRQTTEQQTKQQRAHPQPPVEMQTEQSSPALQENR